MAQDQTSAPHDLARDGAENVALGPRHINSELAKAFEELAKGEQTATALENRLDGIEGKIEQLLASVEEQAREPKKSSSPADGNPAEQPASK